MMIGGRGCLVTTGLFVWLLAIGQPVKDCFADLVFQDRTSNYFSLGAGQSLAGNAAWGDYNNDGWVDLCAAGTIYRNRGGASFSRTASSTGSDGYVWGDFNNDGWLDLFGSNNKTLLQNSKGVLTNVSSKIPSFGSDHVSCAAAWVPLNNTPYLDLYVGGYENPTGDATVGNTTYSSKILTYNKTSGQFTAKWSDATYRARGVTACDFDRNGRQEIYVSDYRLQPNQLWKFNSNGVKTDVASAYGVAGAAHSIGSACGDFNNDGYMDLFVANFSHPGQEPSHFMMNLGPSGGYHFQNMKDLSGADWQESYASAALCDYDNDGRLDLFFTTDYAVGTGGIANYPRLYHNDGNWHFTDVTNSMGLGSLGPTFQAAWGDVNNDGFSDLITDSKLFINTPNGNHWLKIRLEGNGTTVNRSAIGAQARLFLGGTLDTITRQVEGGTGQGNQNELTLEFGLGSYNGLVHGDILWSDDTLQTFSGLAPDHMYSYNMDGMWSVWNNGAWTPLTVPEPASLAALGSGLSLMGVWLLLRRKNVRGEKC